MTAMVLALRNLWGLFSGTLRDLAPIVFIVAFFQFAKHFFDLLFGLIPKSGPAHAGAGIQQNRDPSIGHVDLGKFGKVVRTRDDGSECQLGPMADIRIERQCSRLHDQEGTLQVQAW